MKFVHSYQAIEWGASHKYYTFLSLFSQSVYASLRSLFRAFVFSKPSNYNLAPLLMLILEFMGQRYLCWRSSHNWSYPSFIAVWFRLLAILCIQLLNWKVHNFMAQTWLPRYLGRCIARPHILLIWIFRRNPKLCFQILPWFRTVSRFGWWSCNDVRHGDVLVY